MKKLLKKLKTDKYPWFGTNLSSKEVAIVIDALEKQVPMKPERIMKTMSMCLTKEECGRAYTCDCGAYVGYLHEYCNDCGQKLEWTEVED